ncbi:MAG: TIGR03435 family protein [Acidobacteria bacterium]|nr:TIGR03435 family protein [Acidobacteriota bacterium]
MRSALFAFALLSAVPALRAQDRLSFDTASIKLHKGEVTFSADPSPRGRRVTATASTLLDMVTYAYGVRYDQISGAPPWAGSEHYDVEAASEGEGALTASQAKEMTRSLLAERFQLKIHRETLEVPVYALVVARGGPKLKPAAPDATGGNFVRSGEKGLHMEATRGTMDQLVRQLSYTAGRVVENRTGLAGYYAYTLDWFPANQIPPPDLDAPSMFAAVQEQLGLRLEQARGQVEKLVIDRAERPSAN